MIVEDDSDLGPAAFKTIMFCANTSKKLTGKSSDSEAKKRYR